jgi:hypothetical protein
MIGRRARVSERTHCVRTSRRMRASGAHDTWRWKSSEAKTERHLRAWDSRYTDVVEVGMDARRSRRAYCAGAWETSGVPHETRGFAGISAVGVCSVQVLAAYAASLETQCAFGGSAQAKRAREWNSFVRANGSRRLDFQPRPHAWYRIRGSSRAGGRTTIPFVTGNACRSCFARPARVGVIRFMHVR